MLITKTTSPEAIEAALLLLPPGEYELGSGITVRIDTIGDRRWFKNGKKHRKDGPAIEWANGHREWWINGFPHRENGPAMEWADGGREWWLNGLRHRDDGPAVERADGTQEWWIDGKRKRAK